MAGPALSLHTRSQALDQTLASLPGTTKTVQVTASLSDFTGPLVENGMAVPQNMSRGELAESTRELAHGFATLPLPLAPGAWSGLNTKEFVVSGAGPRTQTGAPPKLEVLYRGPLTSNAQVVAGTYASASVPAGMLAVAATTQMAARYGLHPGSRLAVATPSGPVRLFVTAILRESAPARHSGRRTRPRARRRSMQLTARASRTGSGGVFADPDQFGRDAGRVRRARPGAELGIPARRRRRDRGPGAGAGQRPQPRGHGHARADRDRWRPARTR